MDILGGDAAPATLVRGALDAATRAPAKLIFFGDSADIEPLLEGTRHKAVHAPHCLEVDDSLRGALRADTDSSMHRAVRALARGDADAMVSAGSTGALVALSRHVVGMLPGIRRPAIMKSLGGADGRRFQMLDLGANIGSPPEQLHQFALMGSAATASGVGAALGERTDPARVPTVGLLNIGSEVRKGPVAVQEAARLLEADGRLSYAGYVEPHRLFDAGTDVVVADGFVGNIALKAAEGAAQMARYVLKRELGGNSLPVAVGRALLGGRLRRVRDAYNPQSYNGASLLGIAAVVVKSHGGADREGFGSAVRQAMDALETGLVERLVTGI
ncbi:MAG: phosphate acyltransferase PlsX [Gammaproteobacteria bacterium]|nr:phosphate acyltransferase PlsX [Gammaproteobacteria bacterium]